MVVAPKKKKMSSGLILLAAELEAEDSGDTSDEDFVIPQKETAVLKRASSPLLKSQLHPFSQNNLIKTNKIHKMNSQNQMTQMHSLSKNTTMRNQLILITKKTMRMKMTRSQVRMKLGSASTRKRSTRVMILISSSSCSGNTLRVSVVAILKCDMPCTTHRTSARLWNTWTQDPNELIASS